MDNEKFSLAERAFLNIAQEYYDRMKSLNGARPPASLYDLSYACLMLCIEGNIRDSVVVIAAAIRCRNTVDNWLDALPWNLIENIVNPGWGYDWFAELDVNLINGDSSIRAYMMDLAWFVRSKMAVRTVADAMLKNVADTLGYVGEAISLCVAMFPTLAEFWAYAEAYSPPALFEEQYRDRLADLKKGNVAQYTVLHMELDIRVRKLILQRIFEIDANERAGVAQLRLPLS